MNTKTLITAITILSCLNTYAQKGERERLKGNFTIVAIDSATGEALDSVTMTVQYYYWIKKKSKYEFSSLDTITFDKKFKLEYKEGNKFLEILQCEKPGYETCTYTEQTTEGGKDFYRTLTFRMVKKKKAVNIIEVK